MPLRFITSTTRSTAVPPSWLPKLPPSMVIAAGALQVPGRRQEANPLPYLPPNRNAPLIRPGMMMTHCALLKRTGGIGLSEVWIAAIAVAACARRLSGVCSCAKAAAIRLPKISIEIRIVEVFIEAYPSCAQSTGLWNGPTRGRTEIRPVDELVYHLVSRNLRKVYGAARTS